MKKSHETMCPLFLLLVCFYKFTARLVHTPTLTPYYLPFPPRRKPKWILLPTLPKLLPPRGPVTSHHRTGGIFHSDCTWPFSPLLGTVLFFSWFEKNGSHMSVLLSLSLSSATSGGRGRRRGQERPLGGGGRAGARRRRSRVSTAPGPRLRAAALGLCFRASGPPVPHPHGLSTTSTSIHFFYNWIIFPLLYQKALKLAFLILVVSSSNTFFLL